MLLPGFIRGKVENCREWYILIYKIAQRISVEHESYRCVCFKKWNENISLRKASCTPLGHLIDVQARLAWLVVAPSTKAGLSFLGLASSAVGSQVLHSRLAHSSR